MKRLWKNVPPCMSDVLGFEAVLNETRGVGIIDDPSRYKPLRSAGSADDAGRWRGGYRHGGRGGSGIRVLHSDIRNGDVICGTEEKVLSAFEEARERFQPDFALLCSAPSSAMIGSDLERCAELISQRSGIPCAWVDIVGERDYLYGIGVTLEAMGRLLIERRETQRGTVNLLGCNSLDWTAETLASLEGELGRAGWSVLSRWGMKEDTERLKNAAAAQVNLVVSAGGVRLARYMEREFNIPCFMGAPFGRRGLEDMLRFLRGEEQQERKGSGTKRALVISEQLMAHGLRLALYERGWGEVHVMSFYDMEQSLLREGDRRLVSEDELRGLGEYDLVLCDRDYYAAMNSSAPHIPLPNGGSFSPVHPTAGFDMCGEKLDKWLDGELSARMEGVCP